MRERFGLRSSIAGLTVLAAAAVMLLVVGSASGSVTGAVSTTDNVGFVDTWAPLPYTDQACSNGHGINCNIYLDKRDVWMSGLPNSASLAQGTYFFAVIVPGGQPNPNDGGAKNLSDTTAAPWNPGDTNADTSAIPSGDLYGNRTFTVDALGNISYGGTHNVTLNNTPNAEIQMFPYDDTTNNGGVYILAVCSLGDGTAYPVDPHNCKYDAFKVQIGGGTPPVTPPAFDLTAFKSATPSFTRTYSWDSAKSVNPTGIIRTSSATATASYTVTATWSGPVDSGWQVNGTIDVVNPNAATVDASVSDKITTDGTTDDGNETCTVYDPVNTTTALASPYTFAANSDTALPYTCTYNSSGPAATAETNVATISWAAQTLSNTAELAAGSTPATQAIDWSTPTTTVNNTAIVTDAFNGGAATKVADVNVNGTFSNVATGATPSYNGTTKTFTFTYSRTLTVTPNTCTTDPNTVALTGLTDPTTSDNTASVTVCGRVTGGLTIGFWSNNNGKAVLCTHDPGWRALLNGSGTGAFLRNASGVGFYTVPATGTCNSADANFASWLLNASATNMSYMLSAQLAGTMLNVNYNGMVGTTCIAGTDGNPITINTLIANAIAFLRLNGNTTASGTARNTATAYKNIFDTLNNGNGFAVPGPCA